MSDQFIYFAHDSRGTGLVKIGTSWKPWLRVRALENQLGRELALYGFYPGGRPVETQFHLLFLADHVQGEWFRFSWAIVDVIEQIQAGTFDPAKLPRGKSPMRSAAAYRAHETRRRNALREAA